MRIALFQVSRLSKIAYIGGFLQGWVLVAAGVFENRFERDVGTFTGAARREETSRSKVIRIFYADIDAQVTAFYTIRPDTRDASRVFMKEPEGLWALKETLQIRRKKFEMK